MKPHGAKNKQKKVSKTRHANKQESTPEIKPATGDAHGVKASFLHDYYQIDVSLYVRIENRDRNHCFDQKKKQ